jgi:hypothetical protein
LLIFVKISDINAKRIAFPSFPPCLHLFYISSVMSRTDPMNAPLSGLGDGGQRPGRSYAGGPHEVLIAQDVVFKMCANTLKEFNLAPQKDLVIPMIVVPAGVAELAKLQQEGYAYIKP